MTPSIVGVNLSLDHTADVGKRVIEIPLNQGYVAFVDEQDADIALSAPKWTSSKKRNTVYVSRQVAPFVNRVGKLQYLHILIFERMSGRAMSKGEKVDHINGNGLDCRRFNLRLATHQQNIMNSKLSSANKTGYKGVMMIRGHWIAKITANAKSHYLGNFASAIHAAVAYNKAAVEFFGEYARLNLIEGWETMTPEKAVDKIPNRKYLPKSGFKGVYPYGNRWVAIVQRNKAARKVGIFDTPEQANEARLKFIAEMIL